MFQIDQIILEANNPVNAYRVVHVASDRIHVNPLAHRGHEAHGYILNRDVGINRPFFQHGDTAAGMVAFDRRHGTH